MSASATSPARRRNSTTSSGYFQSEKNVHSEEIRAQLTRIERERNEKDEDVLDEDDPHRESPVKIAERVRQFTRIKELLTATTLGTS